MISLLPLPCIDPCFNLVQQRYLWKKSGSNNMERMYFGTCIVGFCTVCICSRIFQKVHFLHCLYFLYGKFCSREMAFCKINVFFFRTLLSRKPCLVKRPRMAGISYPLEKGTRRTQCAFVYSGAAKEEEENLLFFLPELRKGKRPSPSSTFGEN